MTEEEADRGSAEEAMARVTERLRLARKWCDRAGKAKRGRVDADLVAVTSDGFGAESWARDGHFQHRRAWCLCSNPPLRPVVSRATYSQTSFLHIKNQIVLQMTST